MLHQEKSQKGKVPQQQQCCCSRCCDSTHEAVAHHKKEEALNARRQTQKVSPSKKLYTFSWCYCPTEEYILIWPRMFSITGCARKIVPQQLNPLSKFSSFYTVLSHFTLCSFVLSSRLCDFWVLQTGKKCVGLSAIFQDFFTSPPKNTILVDTKHAV